MQPEVRPFDCALGAEILGVDLARPLADDAFRALEDAWNRHSVLVFRDQRISEEQHIAFSRRFGELAQHVLYQYLHPKHPEIFVVSNIRDESGRPVGAYDAGRYWHTDLSYMAVPSRGSILYAMEIPHADDGTALGDTLWASTAAAYEGLSAEMKQRIEGLEAEFSLENRHRKLVADGDAAAALDSKHKEAAPPVVHKVVCTHPITGRRCIYVNEGQTGRILGVPEEESRALLKTLWAQCTRPEYIYRHHWRVGDVVMWDNIPTQHLAICDYALPQRRYLQRTTLRGSALL
ncbi:MAG TPA: TauD/TfdA family dioxygenase [Burkholderiales bacterium]|nr:TauD/TfdA family dioxygenase [Burkholderiales bacterium]